MAYNPGVSYRGGEFIAQGISQAGNAITAGLQRYAQNREESAALDMSFQTRAQPLLEEMQKFSAKDGQVSPPPAWWTKERTGTSSAAARRKPSSRTW